MSPTKLPLDAAGHLIKGTTVQGKHALADLLDSWLTHSSAPTIGDIGTYGGRPCVHIELGGATTADLNADTKREAVAEYLNEVRRRGADVPWPVIPNRRGPVNKVVFRPDKQPTPGWFCYLRPPLARPGAV